MPVTVSLITILTSTIFVSVSAENDQLGSFSKNWHEIYSKFELIINHISNVSGNRSISPDEEIFNNEGFLQSDKIIVWNGLIRADLSDVYNKIDDSIPIVVLQLDTENPVNQLLSDVVDQLVSVYRIKERSYQLMKNNLQNYQYFRGFLHQLFDTKPQLTDSLTLIHQKLLSNTTKSPEFLSDIQLHTLIKNSYGDDDNRCNNFYPVQKLLYDMCTIITSIEIGGFAALIHGHSIRTFLGLGDYDNELLAMKNASQKRIFDYLVATRNIIRHLSRFIHRCDPADWIRGITFAELEHHLQYFYVNESNFGQDCKHKCYYSDYTRYKLLNEKDRIISCLTITKPAEICFSPPQSARSLEWLKDGHGIYHGHADRTCHSSARGKNLLLLHENLCDACLCEVTRPHMICINQQVATIENNMIVTAVRIIRKNDMIHLQIEEGFLEGRAKVQSVMEWKDVDPCYSVSEFDIDGYHSMYLDDILLPPEYVVTGVSFKPSDNNRGIKLMVQGTRFNFFTGQLDLKQIRWFDPEKTTNLKNRQKVEPDDMDGIGDPRIALNNKPRLNWSSYVEFSHTSLKNDLGQMTIPLFDTQTLRTIPTTPLSSVGLFYKGAQGYGGFIALRIGYINFNEFL